MFGHTLNIGRSTARTSVDAASIVPMGSRSQSGTPVFSRELLDRGREVDEIVTAE